VVPIIINHRVLWETVRDIVWTLYTASSLSVKSRLRRCFAGRRNCLSWLSVHLSPGTLPSASLSFSHVSIIRGPLYLPPSIVSAAAPNDQCVGRVLQLWHTTYSQQWPLFSTIIATAVTRLCVAKRPLIALHTVGTWCQM